MLYNRTVSILILMIWAAGAVNFREKCYREENDPCYVKDYPPSTCQLAINCETVPQYIKAKLLNYREVPICGFKNAFHSMMYCCPLEPPPTTNVITPKKTNFASTHLATLRYLKPIVLDDFVYRCTGVILSPAYVLATTNCISEDIVLQPNNIVIGVTDPRLPEDSEIEIEIMKTVEFNNDLVLFEMSEEIKPSQLGRHVEVATRCTEKDLLGEPNLFAVGFAYDEIEGSNCGLFRQPMKKVDNTRCANIKTNRFVNQLGESHMCFVPKVEKADLLPGARCIKCLTASTSVLHVGLPNGNYCVAGIATPTTEVCSVNEDPLFFTMVTSDTVKDFIKNTIVHENSEYRGDQIN